MKIGRVYANAEREENRADQILIEMGAIAGDGLLGVVAEAVHELEESTNDCGYYSNDDVHLVGAEDRREAAWVKLFAALKAIEMQAKKGEAAIEEARYAMVEGNLDEEPVPLAVIERWLASIEEAL